MDYEYEVDIRDDVEYDEVESGEITESSMVELANGCPVKYSYSYSTVHDDGVRYFEWLSITNAMKKVDGAWVDVTEDEMDEIIGIEEEDGGIHGFYENHKSSAGIYCRMM